MTRVRLIIAASLALALLWAGASVAAASPVASSGAGSASAIAVTSGLKGLKPGQKKARAKQLKRCRKIRAKGKKKRCLKRVKTKFRRIAKRQSRVKPDKPKAPTAIHDVLVTDNDCDLIQSSCFLPIHNGEKDPFVFGQPNTLEIKAGEAVRFVWDDDGRDSAHNVSLWSHPAGVSPFDFEMSGTATVGTTFQRTFTVSGVYQFRCSLHQITQILNVTVTP